MSTLVPLHTPQITLDDLLRKLGSLKPVVPVFLVGLRGYYLDTMGKPNVNDRGIYDDAIILVSPTAYLTCNANCDPSAFRAGIATLKPGVHWFKKGRHGLSKGPGKSYPAFRPDNAEEKLPVTRDGQSGDKWGIAINIHKGSRNSTSSEGCQTVFPDQWLAFQTLAYAEMDRYKQTRIPYVLL
jgi:lysozyme